MRLSRHEHRAATAVSIALFLSGVLASCTSSKAPARADKEQEQRIAELLRSIDKDPDKKHMNVTPAVVELVEIGPPALAPTLEVFASGEEFTRLHASTTILGISVRLMGFEPGRGWESDDAQSRWQRFYASMPLNYNAPESVRAASVAKWRKWISSKSISQAKYPPPRPAPTFDEELLGIR